MQALPGKDNMRVMKKHPFLQVEFISHVGLTTAEKKQINLIFEVTASVLKSLLKKEKLLKSRVPISSVGLSVMLCGDSRMRELNKKSRSKDKVTDVLSFPYHEDLRTNKGPIAEDKKLYLGELAICHGQTKRQAKKFKIRYSDEFTHLFIHGLFHLMGFDHEVSEAEELMMQKMEDRALNEFSKLKKKKGS